MLLVCENGSTAGYIPFNAKPFDSTVIASKWPNIWNIEDLRFNYLFYIYHSEVLLKLSLSSWKATPFIGPKP